MININYELIFDIRDIKKTFYKFDNSNKHMSINILIFLYK